VGGRGRATPSPATSPATERSLSEIVVPVRDAAGRLLAVFDVDSEQRGTFDDDDRQGLERILAWFAEAPAGAEDSGIHGGHPAARGALNFRAPALSPPGRPQYR
jgi:hypothetical protein